MEVLEAAIELDIWAMPSEALEAAIELDIWAVSSEALDEIGKEKVVHGAKVEISVRRLEGVETVASPGVIASIGPVVFMKEVGKIERSDNEA